MTFKSGKSGNPKGRPKGALSKRTELAKLLEERADDLIAKAIEMALSGDPMILRFCLERLIPKAIDKQVMVVMPDLTAIESSKIIPALLTSLAGQTLSVSEFNSMLNIFIEHDNEVHNKQEDENMVDRINAATDPIEASRIYCEIMTGTYKK